MGSKGLMRSMDLVELIEPVIVILVLLLAGPPGKQQFLTYNSPEWADSCNPGWGRELSKRFTVSEKVNDEVGEEHQGPNS